MPKRSRKPPADPGKAAHSILEAVIKMDQQGKDYLLEQVAKDPFAVALGRRGGLRGGPARTKALTVAQRKASAKKAAEARWGTRRRKP